MTIGELNPVNDGSTNGSGKMSQEFAELINAGESLGSVLYIEHENMGAVFSRERGIAHATGDYVLYIDADDYWDNNLIE